MQLGKMEEHGAGENWKRGGVWRKLSSRRRKIYLSPRKKIVVKNKRQETKKKIGEKDSGKKERHSLKRSELLKWKKRLMKETK